MRNDKLAKYEISGQIISIFQHKNQVEFILRVLNDKVQIKIPRAYCNPKRFNCNDVIKVYGAVADYNENNKHFKYTVIFAKCSVRCCLETNCTNNKADFTSDLSLVGSLQAYKEDDEDNEFYQIIFRSAETDEAHTLYMLKTDFINFMNNEFAERRLIHVLCRTNVIQWHELVSDVPVSKISHYVVSMKTI